MSVTLSDEQARLLHEALRAAVTLDTFEESAVSRVMDLEEQAYAAICEALGVTPAVPSNAATSQPAES